MKEKRGQTNKETKTERKKEKRKEIIVMRTMGNYYSKYVLIKKCQVSFLALSAPHFIQTKITVWNSCSALWIKKEK